MTDLRSKLIRLAHTNPELRGDILPLIVKESAQVRSPGWAKDPMVAESAVRALNVVADKLDLPFKWTRASQTEIEVKPPKDFSALLKSTKIIVAWASRGMSAQVQWHFNLTHLKGAMGGGFVPLASLEYYEDEQEWRVTTTAGHTETVW